MNSSPNSNIDLPWLAFRYICGEMAAGEEEAFELRLADDQTAREAVAEAVELRESIRIVSAEPAPVRRRIVRLVRRPAVVMTAIAACLLLAFGLLWHASNRNPGQVEKTGEKADQIEVQQEAPATEEDVVLTWVEMQRQSDGQVADAQVSEPALGFEGELGVDELKDEAQVPEWMLVAFSPEGKRNKGNR